MSRRHTKRLPTEYVFTEKDYNSNDGMLTTVWGPGIWHFLHTMSFNYPVHPTDDDKRHYREFVLNLKNTLPCGKCRKNMRKNLRALPLLQKHMASRAAFSKYIYDLHEHINRMLKKESGLTYEMVRERYEHFRARCAIPIQKMHISAGRKTRKHLAKPKTENGCTEPLFGEKSKCVLKIVPHDTKCNTLEIDQKCVKKKLTGGDIPTDIAIV